MLAAVYQAEADDKRDYLDAGLIDHLFGHHGAVSMAKVKTFTAAIPTVARMLLKIWRYQLADELWDDSIR